ncbi:MAG: RagB/SusD family nutrient uptake outer membrane protein [Tannerella sp.]|nr:RagB/SusD family nutrient uptake outer membrane protein [Tannerella sp.]
MKSINKIFTKIPLLIAVLLLVSCENFLELTPDNAIVTGGNQTISSAGTLRAAIIGAYNDVQGYSGNYIALGTAPADNVVFSGTLSQFLQLDQNAVSPDNSTTVATYRSLYQAINSSNTIIAAIETLNDPLLSAAEKNKILGEAYFIRALGYFDLARGWGGVQIQTKPTESPDAIKGIKRSSQAETYDRVEADLFESEKLLPDDISTRNRAQKSTAKALLARLYLYREQWEKAEQYASEVIANDKYKLVKPYGNFFASPYLSSESVFELTYTTNDRNGISSTWLPSALGGGYNLKPSEIIEQKLDDANIGGSRNALIKYHREGLISFLYTTLYANTARTDAIYQIRIAELYLIRAEARAKKTSPDLAGAVNDLNAVRDRSDVPLWTNITDQAKIIEAIENENSVEFAFEAHRWFDLVRTRRAGDVLGVTNQNFWLFPIPQSDILSDPDVTQNPGY